MWLAILMNILNITLNYAFIFGKFGFPAFGSAGAAYGTLVSVFVVTIIWLVITKMKCQNEGLFRCLPDRVFFTNLYKKSIVLSIGNGLFFLGINVFFFLCSMMGTEELAAANVLLRIYIFLLVFQESVGLIAGTLVSQALGRGDAEDASKWGWDAVKVGVLGALILGLPFLIFPTQALSYFFTSPDVISLSALGLQLAVLTTLFGAIAYVLGKGLVCIGHGGPVMALSFVMQWLFALPLVWFLGPYMELDLIYAWGAYLSQGVITAVLIIGMWVNGKWKTATI